MAISDWMTTKLEGFLTLNDREILQNAAKVSAELARTHTDLEFVKFHAIEDRERKTIFDSAVK
jgi:hypothetical protein